jgi:hypothetical protein
MIGLALGKRLGPLSRARMPVVVQVAIAFGYRKVRCSTSYTSKTHDTQLPILWGLSGVVYYQSQTLDNLRLWTGGYLEGPHSRTAVVPANFCAQTKFSN